MLFFHRHLATVPLTEGRMSRTLNTARYTVRYRFELVLAVDRTEQEYFLCHRTQLATLTAQQFAEALALALSFRLR